MLPPVILGSLAGGAAAAQAAAVQALGYTHESAMLAKFAGVRGRGGWRCLFPVRGGVTLRARRRQCLQGQGARAKRGRWMCVCVVVVQVCACVCVVVVWVFWCWQAMQ